MIHMLLLLFSVSTLSAQSVKVSGVVKTSGQEPLVSVSVKVKNSQIGTMTDANGRFSLEVPWRKSVLVFTDVGFIEKTVTVGHNRTLDVIM